MKQKQKYRGLTAAQVALSRERHGSNVYTPVAGTPWWKQLLKKFADPLIIILLVAGALSMCISIYEHLSLGRPASVYAEPAGIFVAVLIATVMAFVFEWRANREFNILNSVSDDEPVEVVRDGKVRKIARKEVVVGDIVMLNQGDEVPADGTLLRASRLSIDESSLTGEPVAHKSSEPPESNGSNDDGTYPRNVALKGTKVMEGRGVMQATAVGDKAEAGKVMKAVQISNNVRTPLNEQLDRLGKKISIGGYTIAALVLLVRFITFFIEHGFTGFEWVDFSTFALQTLMLAVSLVVMAVPEGLPIAVTLSLAYSMRRMLRTNNLVRTMHACETMGAATVICTDKTGTLTQNQMQVWDARFYTAGGTFDLPDDSEAARRLALTMAACSTAHLLVEPQHDGEQATAKVIGNPTEGALLLWLRGLGIDYLAVRDSVTMEAEIPFSSERKFMAVVVSSPESGQRWLLVKGAPEVVIELCGDKIAGGTTRDTLRQHQNEYTGKAMRTLALASATLNDGEEPIKDSAVECPSLTLEALVAISDPVRHDVPAAVEKCKRAGVQVKVVTGDTAGTAREVARQIGLWHDDTPENALITGRELDALDDKQLEERANELRVVARARPADKKRLVEALQRLGHVVAVTGDGTNDAPALKAAHVGLSMGDGTAVAKEASDITIIDNSFASITRAVQWGRSLYRNIQRFLLFQLTVNVAACLIVLAGAFMGTQSPITITQMLWVNLIMDTFAAIALASLPPSQSVMAQKPRDRRKFIITNEMRNNIFLVGGVLFGAVLVALLGCMHYYQIMPGSFRLEHCHRSLLTPHELTLFFTTFVMLQFWNLFNVRAHQSPRTAIRFKGCGEFWLIASLILAGQVVIVSWAGEVFNAVPLTLAEWLIIIGATSLVLVAGEVSRALKRAKISKHGKPLNNE